MGFIKRCWQILAQPSARWSLLALLTAGFFGGIFFWGGFHTAMDATNTLEFCTGCHEMRDTVFQEYKETIHYANRTGVRAVCSDCHVPRDWAHKVLRKVQATHELWGKIVGVIDTPAKFEARRIVLAQHQWDTMKSTDSRECRNCHAFDAMSKDIQKASVYAKHMKAKADGKTCIDCHKGIAHKLPKEYKDEDE
jgi:cytochrome c-type protein NapC